MDQLIPAVIGGLVTGLVVSILAIICVSIGCLKRQRTKEKSLKISTQESVYLNNQREMGEFVLFVHTEELESQFEDWSLVKLPPINDTTSIIDNNIQLSSDRNSEGVTVELTMT